MYEEIGGHPDWELFEDVDIVKRIRGHAWLWPQKKLRVLNANIFTDAAKYNRDGYVKRGLRNIGLSIKFLRGGNPKALAKHYK